MNRLARMAAILGLAVAALGPIPAWGKSDELSDHYKNKFMVLLHDGVSLGVCGETPDYSPSHFQVKIESPPVDFDAKNELLSQKTEQAIANLNNLTRSEFDSDASCGPIPEPIHKGEILASSRASVHGKWVMIWVSALSYHSITRGVGAFQHESKDIPSAVLMFPTEGGYAQAKALIDQWFETFDTLEEADKSPNAKPSNTASGVSVKQIKLGMTPAEVEAALGVPDTRVDLGEKVLYKYKDMTVEFHDGKVTDVK